MGIEIAALMGFFGLTSAFALVATILAAWMAWRIVEKTGLPGWAGLGAILLDADRHRLDRAAGAAVGVRLHALAARRAGGGAGYGAAPAGGPAGPRRPRLGATGGGVGRPAGLEAARQPCRAAA